ncbi:SpaH/EbpB family LPXTG-anchored major pilin [Georgenia sp. Marseille-Q6866]
MSRTTRRLGRLTVMAAGALTMGMLGAAPAGATTTGPNLDPDQLGSLTIHKFEEPDGGGIAGHDGSELTGAARPDSPLAGVQFTVSRVSSIDLATNEGWQAVEDLTAAEVTAAPTTYPLSTPDADRTDASGTVSFHDLSVGVYLVEETDTGGHPIAVRAEPFLVSVPLPTQDSTWNYDVHVYPKNSVTAIRKTVDDDAAWGLGDAVTWSVDVTVPRLPAGEVFTTFAITDELDDRLAYTRAEVTLDGSGLDATAVTLTHAAGTLSATFTSAGLAALDGAQGGTVQLMIDTTVTSVGDGIIPNDATVTINEFTATTSRVQTEWGALALLKYAETAAGDRAGLEGARFQIFRTPEDAAAGTHPVAVLVGGERTDTFTSAADGSVLVPGLFAGEVGTTYWVVETEAPVGYTGASDPIEVTVHAGSTTEAEGSPVGVLNHQRPLIELPLTGAAGTVLFTLLGMGLVTVAVGAALRHRRRAGQAG